MSNFKNWKRRDIGKLKKHRILNATQLEIIRRNLKISFDPETKEDIDRENNFPIATELL